MRRRFLGIVTGATLTLSLFGTAEAFADTPTPDAGQPSETTSPTPPLQNPTPAPSPSSSPIPDAATSEPPEDVSPETAEPSESESNPDDQEIGNPTDASVPEPAPHQRATTATPIQQRYQQLGGPAGKLGAAIGGENCSLKDGGCFQRYQGGSIHYTPSTGAHPTWGSIQARWAKLGYENGKLGYPIGAENCTLKDGGCYQQYQGGSIHYTPSTGAHPTWGTIQTRWAGLGYENGKLGYPTSGEICGLKNGGCYQQYQGGSIHYTPSTGAHPTWGGIQARWANLKYENGHLGYPTSSEVCGLKNGGCYQQYQGGSIHYSPSTGAHSTFGIIQQRWASSGYERGSMGYPLGEQSCRGGVCKQRFQHGWLTDEPVPNIDSRCLTGRVMCASKKDRKMWWVIDGKVQRTFDARFGCPGTPSDNGSFRVFWKSYNHTSTIFGTWMPRAMFYNGDEAVHFSQDFQSRGWAGCSAGCVNIRDWAGINWLYDQVRNGDKVVVY